MSRIKYGDIVIVILFLLVSFFYIRNIGLNKTNIIVIEANGKSYRYDQSIDREIIINGILGSSFITITNGEARFLDSPCRDKLCVKAGILKGAPIICIPNAVIMRFDDQDIDSFVQ